MLCCLRGVCAQISSQRRALRPKKRGRQQLKQEQIQNSQTLSLYLPAKIDN